MNALPTLVCALHGVCLQGRSAGPRAPTSANMDDAYAIGPGPRWSSQRRAALERFAAAALRSATALEVQQAKYACWSPDYDLERCPWRQRVGAGIGGEDIAATRRRSSPRHVWWRDGRSTLLVSAAGSDARTKASGMMAGFPCPGAATKAAGGSADARRCRVARAAARGRPLLADREELVCRDVVHRRVYAVCDPPGRWVARESTKPCASTGMSTPPLGPTSGLLHVGQRHHARGRVPPGTHG